MKTGLAIKRLLCGMLLATLLLPVFVFAETAAATTAETPLVVGTPAPTAPPPAPGPTLAEGSTVAKEPEGFEYLKASKQNVFMYYTAIRIPGFEHTVYAFNDKEGRTQFRVYGRLNKKKGMYETRLSSEAVDGMRNYTIEIIGEKPIKDKFEHLARPKARKLDDTTLPEGYKKTTKVGVMYFTNLFKQKEYRVLGEISGLGQAYYPPVYGKPRAGSLAIDITMDTQRFKLADEKYFKVPKEYRQGFAIGVYVTTAEGESIVVMTDKPVLDRDTLK
ncbi:MAG: hypothetical protein GX650_06830 [Clostridiales bacterium]|nr:hypothetical protein [Clostridiales bacterium]